MQDAFPRAYLVSGRMETLEEPLGKAFTDCGYHIFGREIVPPFSHLRFTDQLSLIKEDIETGFFHADALLAGRSYGAYLLVQALMMLPPFPGKIVLFSPVLGEARTSSNHFRTRPPRAKRLVHVCEKGGFPPPFSMEIHMGEMDMECNPSLAKRIAGQIKNTRYFSVQGKGHDPGQKYYSSVIKRVARERETSGQKITV